MGKYSTARMAQGGQKTRLITSFNVSIDSTEDDMVGVNFLRGKGVTE